MYQNLLIYLAQKFIVFVFIHVCVCVCVYFIKMQFLLEALSHGRLHNIAISKGKI